MRRFSRKLTVMVVGAVILVGGGGVAYAFWTAGGSGVGTAATGSSNNITVNQTSTVTAMGPGVAPQALSGNFTNTNTGPVYVGTVTATIASVTPLGAGTCVAADYVIANPAMTVGVEVLAGTNQGAWGGATIAFANSTTVNQDGCKGATVNLAYTVS